MATSIKKRVNATDKALAIDTFIETLETPESPELGRRQCNRSGAAQANFESSEQK